MKPKIIKSGQVEIHALGVECSCGEWAQDSECHSAWSGNTIAGFWCEWCGQEWVFPKNIHPVIKFKRS